MSGPASVTRENLIDDTKAPRTADTAARGLFLLPAPRFSRSRSGYAAKKTPPPKPDFRQKNMSYIL